MNKTFILTGHKLLMLLTAPVQAPQSGSLATLTDPRIAIGVLSITESANSVCTYAAGNMVGFTWGQLAGARTGEHPIRLYF